MAQSKLVRMFGEWLEEVGPGEHKAVRLGRGLAVAYTRESATRARIALSRRFPEKPAQQEIDTVRRHFAAAAEGVGAPVSIEQVDTSPAHKRSQSGVASYVFYLVVRWPEATQVPLI